MKSVADEAKDKGFGLIAAEALAVIRGQGPIGTP
jgi:hypothetical protein